MSLLIISTEDLKKEMVLVTGGTGFIGSHTIVKLLIAAMKLL